MFAVRGPEGPCERARDARVPGATDWWQAGAVAADHSRAVCRTCFVERQVKVGVVDSKKSNTRSFARYVIEVATRMTLPDMVRHGKIPSGDREGDLRRRDSATVCPAEVAVARSNERRVERDCEWRDSSLRSRRRKVQSPYCSPDLRKQKAFRRSLRVPSRRAFSFGG